MKKWILLMIWLSAGLLGFAQEAVPFSVLKGVVKSTKGESLQYVTISVPGTSIGTVTNSDGDFIIKIPKDVTVDRIVVSHLGYANAIIPYEGLSTENIVVSLKPAVNLLDEVLVQPKGPRWLVEEAMKKMEVNYSTVDNALTGFYRETINKRGRFVYICEAVVDVFKSRYDRDYSDRVRVIKGRKILSQNQRDTIAVKLLGGPNIASFGDLVKNPDVILDEKELNQYSFAHSGYVDIDNEPHYIIEFKPNPAAELDSDYPLYYGKLYINKLNLAFSRIEVALSMNYPDKVTKDILKKKPVGLRFSPSRVIVSADYKRQDDGKYYLHYIRNAMAFRCDWRRRLFRTSYVVVSEYVTTDKFVEGVEKISFKDSFKSTQSLSDRVEFFEDVDFWGSYNIIEPTESLEHAVERLRKQ